MAEATSPARAFSQPRPRPSRSAQDVARIRVRNRRLEYLQRNPAYVESSDREFANVTLYNTLIRNYQTPAERRAEAQDKGFGQILEASILRNPEPLEREQSPDEEDIVEEEEVEACEVTVTVNGIRLSDGSSNGNGNGIGNGISNGNYDGISSRAKKDENEAAQEELGGLEGLSDDEDNVSPREAARRRWHAFVRDWFVRGDARDDGFDYDVVDDESDYDVLERAEAEDAWFDDESPGWASEDDAKGEEDKERGRKLTGETGIQDF